MPTGFTVEFVRPGASTHDWVRRTVSELKADDAFTPFAAVVGRDPLTFVVVVEAPLVFVQEFERIVPACTPPAQALNSGSWRCWFQDRGAFLVAYALCPIKAPAERRAAVSEFITRINYGLAVGNFELDFEDGEIRFKNGIASHSRDDVVGPRLARRLFQYVNWAMDDYIGGLMSVLFGGAAVEDAVLNVEEARARRRATRRADADSDPEPTEPEPGDVNPTTTSDELQRLLADLEAGFGARPNDDENEQSSTDDDFAF